MGDYFTYLCKNHLINYTFSFAMKRLLKQLTGALLAAVTVGIPVNAAPAATMPSTKTITKTNRHQYFRKRHSENSKNIMLRHDIGRVGAKSLRPVQLRAADNDIPQLYGNVIDSYELESYGLYKLPTSADGAFEPIALDIADEGAGVEVDGIYYFTNYDYGEDLVTVMGYDVYTGEEVYSAEGTYDNVAISMCYDPTDGKIYGIFQKDTSDGVGGLQLATVDYSGTVPVTTHIADIDEEQTYLGLAVNSLGQLYALVGILDNYWMAVDTKLVTVSKTTGEMTEVGLVGFTSEYSTDACIDLATDRMFYPTCNSMGCSLVEVDLSTGAGTELFAFSGDEQIAGLVCPAPPVAAGAPAAVTGLSLDFPMGALTGTVSFTCPSTLKDGTPASGAVECRILIDNEEAVAFQTSYGATENRALTVGSAGMHSVSVVLSNSEGEGQIARLKTFFGEDAPALPAAVNASFADGKMTIGWLPVTAGVNGGYIDASAIRYTLACTQPAEAVIAESTTQTEFALDLQEPEARTVYTYLLSVYYGDALLGTVASNSVVLGSLIPPYYQDFSGENPLEDFTILNENGDNLTWRLFDSNVRMEYNSAMAMDDWLILPAMKLTAGRTYKVAFRAWAQSLATPERIEVCYGVAPEASAMTGDILPPTMIEVLGEDAQTTSATFSPESTGLYYIGFHAISDANTYYLYVDDIAVTPEAVAEAPKAPSDFTVVPDALGHLSVNISMKAPVEDAAGSPLTSLKEVNLMCDRNIIHTFTAPAPGAELTFVHTPEAPGQYLYSAVAVSEAGESSPSEQTVFCGTSLPSDVTGVKVTENGHTGEVTLEWDAVTTDVTGREIDPELVKYNIFTVKGTALEVFRQNVSGTKLTHQAVEGDSQDFVKFAVYGVTAAGMGNGMNSDMIPVGKPYTTFSETFADCDMSYLFGVNVINEGMMNLYNDEYLENLSSHNGDNGFLVIYGQVPGQRVELSSGKISIEGVVDPVLTLWVYKFADEDENTLKIETREAGKAFTTALDLRPSSLESVGWNQVTVPLNGYEGGVIQFRLTGVIKNYGSIAIDDIEVASKQAGSSVVEASNAPEVRGGQGVVDILGADALPVAITSADGRVVYTLTGTSRMSVPLPAGIYLVTVADTTAKVSVR